MPDHKLNLPVGKLPPILNDRGEAILWNLIDNFANFAASCVNGQPKCLQVLSAGNSVRRIVGANA
jgi:hypothetical protein